MSHYGTLKTCWDWLILIATFYVAIVVPYSASFRESNDTPATIYTDVFVEIVFIIGERIQINLLFIQFPLQSHEKKSHFPFFPVNLISIIISSYSYSYLNWIYCYRFLIFLFRQFEHFMKEKSFFFPKKRKKIYRYYYFFMSIISLYPHIPNVPILYYHHKYINYREW